MSKDFEQAYKELAQSEIPDLWDRIEAGLSEKSTPGKDQEKNQEKTKQIHFRRYAGMAAAVVCVALVIPAAFFMRDMGKSSNMEMAADQSGMEESMELAECAPEDAEGGEVEAADAMPLPEEISKDEAEDTGMMLDTAAGAAQNTAIEEASRENRQQTNEEGAVTESIAQIEEERADSLSASKLNEIAEMEDGTIIEGVTVNIIGGTRKEVEGDDIDKIGAVCSAIVHKDETGLFEEGEQIEIFIPLYSSTALFEDSAYNVDLVYRRGEEYPFMLRGLHGTAE